MNLVLEEERRSGRSYFSYLPRDLTAIYLPQFLGYWINSSRWLEGTFSARQITISGLGRNNSIPLIQGNQLFFLSGRTGVGHDPPLVCPLVDDPSPLTPVPMIPSSLGLKFDCMSTFLPNESIISGGCRHNPDVVLTQLTPVGWTQRTLLSDHPYSHLSFDSAGMIYLHKDGQLFCFTSEGELRWKQTTSMERIYDHVVIQGCLFFVGYQRLYKLILATQELISYPIDWIAASMNLYTDHQQYVLIKQSFALHIFDLQGTHLREISFLHLSLDRYASLVLHPNGDFYFFTRSSDLVTIVSLQ